MPLRMEFVETPLQDAITFLQDAHAIPFVVDRRRIKNVDLPLSLSIDGIDLCSALTLLVAPHGLVIEYRYGVLFLTTPNNVKDWRDPTGVSEIRPPAGGALARVWNEPSMMEFVETPLGDATRFLADFMAIEIDVTALPERIQKMRVTKNVRGVPWHDAVALMLDDLSLRCEARGGDTLVLLPGPITDSPTNRLSAPRLPTPVPRGKAPPPPRP